MGGGGGKGGSTSTEVSIPEWLQQAAQSGLARGTQAAGIGYAPYIGPDMAALTPLQEAAMANTGQAASAFGLGASPLPSAGMPEVQTFAGGMRGYSAFPLYEQAINELKMRDPVQYAKLMAPFSGDGQFGITSMPMGGGAQSYGQPMRDGPFQGSGASRDYGSTAADRIAQGGGGGAMFGGLSSRMPGGVDTRNPNSLANRIAAGLTSRPQGEPTAASRPKASPVAKTKTAPASKPKAETKKTNTPSRGGVGRR